MKPATHSPLYVVFFPELAEIARRHGYAMAAHGSIASDFDLICIPWVESAGEPEDVIAEISREFSFPTLGTPSLREHGRRVWTLSMGGPGYIDLSFTPRTALKEREGE